MQGHNEELRALMQRHFNQWRITDESEKMEIHGWLKATGVEVRVYGLRRAAVDTIEALIRHLVAAERVPENPTS